jgi:hypothetical protein
MEHYWEADVELAIDGITSSLWSHLAAEFTSRMSSEV